MIRLEHRGPVLAATLDRGLQNTIDDALADALQEALDQAQTLGVALLHLRSAGPHFCGGADPARVARWLGDGGRDAIDADTRRWDDLFRNIEAAPTIVLAEVRGNALGAGLGLALACDLRIAAASARIGVPEVRVGLLPAGSTVRRLVELAGTVTAQRLLLAGELIDGTDAYRVGMMHWVVDDEALAERTRDLAERTATQSSAALREAKGLLATSRGRDARAAAAAERLAFSRLIADDEPRGRIQALLGRLAGRPS
ncbi:MAG: enoyl-CoA hydratase/isomerase family protein [Lautropia sp.]